MDLRQLRYFLEIADQGSVSAAARRLSIAQPALSTHLRNMEDQLGTPLLLRGRNGVVPTEAGEVLRAHARRMLDDQSRIEDEIRNLGQDPAGEVRIGLPGTVSDIVTVPLIEAVRRRYPRIRLTVSEAMSGFVAAWLREGAVDIGVLYARPEDPGLTSMHLLNEELVVVAPPRHLPQDRIRFQDFAGLVTILPTRAHGLRRMLDRAAAAEGVDLKPEIELDSYVNMKALVRRGLGVTVLPLHAVQVERQAGQITTRPFYPGLHRGLHMVQRSTVTAARATTAISEMMESVVEALITDGSWAGAAKP